MRIVMFTNTFTPHVGGVARSVEQFAGEFRKRGHRVLIVAPEFPNTPADESDVVRIPALQRFNGSDFSVPTPIPGFLEGIIHEFQPEVIHSHHPFLLGDTALRFAAMYNVPMVFTHHTQYERYTHYVPGDCVAMKQFVLDLAAGYCNLCDAVIAPSESIRDRLVAQGVTSEIHVIPTGVDVALFSRGDRRAARSRFGYLEDDLVLGHIGRLAPEKGLDFLSQVLIRFLASHPQSRFLCAGTGPSAVGLAHTFQNAGLRERMILLGSLDRQQLPDVYAAMDAFVFASQSETQGMVLTEAMAAGTPVIAVDASGVREVVCDRTNGRLLPREDIDLFVSALHEFAHQSPAEREAYRQQSHRTAQAFSLDVTATRELELYQSLRYAATRQPIDLNPWSMARRRLEEEWKIWTNAAGAAVNAIF